MYRKKKEKGSLGGEIHTIEGSVCAQQTQLCGE